MRPQSDRVSSAQERCFPSGNIEHSSAIHQYLHLNLEISREEQIAQKQAQRDDYDRTAKNLQDLQQFQSVLFQLDPKKPILQKAKVVQQPSESSPRRYEVQTESGARYFRNRRHVRSAIEIQPEELYQAPSVPGTEPAQQQLMSLTSHHKSHCSNSVCRKRPLSELRCLVHDVLLDHLRDKLNKSRDSITI